MFLFKWKSVNYFYWSQSLHNTLQKYHCPWPIMPHCVCLRFSTDAPIVNIFKKQSFGDAATTCSANSTSILSSSMPHDLKPTMIYYWTVDRNFTLNNGTYYVSGPANETLILSNIQLIHNATRYECTAQESGSQYQSVAKGELFVSCKYIIL